MLSEYFVASISKATKPILAKDAGIYLEELQSSTPVRRNVFKKSATPPCCLAVSDSHVFAAQSEKAVVHVYSRAKGTQEATVPLRERIQSVCVAAEGTILVLGSDGGRIYLWETCTGRLIFTPPSHLQPVTSLVVDPTSNFILSGSPDSNIHVWLLPQLLSFSASENEAATPLHSLSDHRGPVTALAIGHSSSSANIAVSASKDSSAIVWDFRSGTALRTYLLGASPLALALDPADRAFYASFEDGSVQQIDFFDPAQQAGPVHNLHDLTVQSTPVQPPRSSRWAPVGPQDVGSALSLDVGWDGSYLISGHESGKVVIWDTARGAPISWSEDLYGPVTNVCFLTPTGFPHAKEPGRKLDAVVKPNLSLNSSAGASGNGSLVPASYTLSTRFRDRAPKNPQLAFSPRECRPSKRTAFQEALAHPSFPDALVAESYASLLAFSESPSASNRTKPADAASTTRSHSRSPSPSTLATSTSDLSSTTPHQQASYWRARYEETCNLNFDSVTETFALRDQVERLTQTCKQLVMERERERERAGREARLRSSLERQLEGLGRPPDYGEERVREMVAGAGVAREGKGWLGGSAVETDVKMGEDEEQEDSEDEELEWEGFS